MVSWSSKLSAKGQVTVPKEVRETVGLEVGDLVEYRIEDGRVIMTRIELFDALFHKAVSETLDEWASPEDDEAFHDL